MAVHIGWFKTKKQAADEKQFWAKRLEQRGRTPKIKRVGDRWEVYDVKRDVRKKTRNDWGLW